MDALAYNFIFVRYILLYIQLPDSNLTVFIANIPFHDLLVNDLDFVFWMGKLEMNDSLLP